MYPPKSRVMTKMEELIHHFYRSDRRTRMHLAEKYISQPQNPKARTWLLHQQQRRRRAVSAKKFARHPFVNLSILHELLPGCLVSDVPAVLGSLDFVMGECDR